MKQTLVTIVLATIAIASGIVARGADDGGTPLVKLIKTIPLGGEGRWDYLCVDADARRLYVPRSTHTQVVDLDSGALLGDIAKTNGVHGVALAPQQKLAFISNGKDNAVAVVDPASLKTVKTIKAGTKPDAIIFDPASKHIFCCNHGGGTVTVIDPAALEKEPVTIEVGGALEFAVADGAGHVFVNVEDKNEVAQIDSNANKVLARWTVAPGDGPTGLAIDIEHHRLFSGCGNEKMIVLDSQTGKILATLDIGKGVDGVAFDPSSGLAMSANGKDGTISVVKEVSPGSFKVVQTAQTLAGARTIALDEKKDQVLMPCNVPDGHGGMTFGIAVVGAP